MKRFVFLLCLIFAVMSLNILYGQVNQQVQQEKARQQILSKTDTVALKRLGSEFEKRYKKNRADAIEWARKMGYLIKGNGVELQGFQNGIPRYFTTYNNVAAKTVSTDKVMPGGSAGLNLEGQGIKIGIWDEGAVYTAHSSFRESSSGPYHAYFVDSTGSTFNDHEILFAASYNSPPVMNIWKINLQNGKMIQMTFDGGNYPAYNPAGDKIVYANTNINEGGLWIMNRDGSYKWRFNKFIWVKTCS